MNNEKSIKQINEKFWILNDELCLCVNEIVRIEKYIIVHNDKETEQDTNNFKFAHFHYNNIHFKFMQECPQNITQLKQMIAFESEKCKISDNDLRQLLKLLQRRPSNTRRIKAINVYDYTIGMWETLNERPADYID